MKIAICDDEPLARERLCDLVEGSEHDCSVVAIAANGQEAIAAVEANDPDVILLDIRMPGLDGIGAARHWKERLRPLVIFCTAYDDQALAAFDVAAIDYLVKPIRQRRLDAALARAQRLLQQDSEQRGRNHFSVRLGRQVFLLPVVEVVYLHADHKYTQVRHADGEALIEESLTSLEQEFGDRFVRIHRNALVARSAITGLVRNEAGRTCVQVRDVDELLEVSRRRLPEIRKVIQSL